MPSGEAADCVQEGQRFSAKEPDATCCRGLTRIENDRPAPDPSLRLSGYATGCEPAGPPDIKVCTACGDSRCGAGENRCNCPADCQ